MDEKCSAEEMALLDEIAARGMKQEKVILIPADKDIKPFNAFEELSKIAGVAGVAGSFRGSNFEYVRDNPVIVARFDEKKEAGLFRDFVNVHCSGRYSARFPDEEDAPLMKWAFSRRLRI